MTKKIELLSPAGNIDCGIEAINHGADAVYIGASKFGARSAAGNTLTDIEKLCSYAHHYFARVYVALNTILTDRELEEAEVLIRKLYEAGTDALIIQDMGLLKLDLPPIPLHASTQTDNRTVEKIKFFKEAGLQRVILARELSIADIRDISEQTDIELEAFVHGALCVSYSGQCYMSQSSCKRSANRGSCAQLCRMPYTLVDKNGKEWIRDKYLLSLKDMNRTDYLEEMLNAGITSFKIEGRLKELSYVKNITAHYRLQLDRILEGKNGSQKSSSGKVIFDFIPAPEKSFNRGMTPYFTDQIKEDITQWNTPKSIGEYVGKIRNIGKNFITVDSPVTFANGDGLCFLDSKEVLQGFRINSIDGDRIIPASMPDITPGTELYRNWNQTFEKQLLKNSAHRKIRVDITFKETDEGVEICFEDEDHCKVFTRINTEKITAKDPEQSFRHIKEQFSKLGNTIFEAGKIDIDLSQPCFFPVSQLANWRREMVDKLFEERTTIWNKNRLKIFRNAAGLFPPKTHLTYLSNVMNSKAADFYKQTGVMSVDPAFEIKPLKDVPVMFCRYCIKYALGGCIKKEGKDARTFPEPLFLKNKYQVYRLEFDCEKCEMRIIN